MGLLSAIFGSGPIAVGKGAAGAAVDLAKGVSDIVDKWHPSEESKQQMYMEVNKLVQDSAASARSYDPRTTGTTKFAEVVNVVVDAVSRLIRPGVTILLIGAVFGWWPVVTKSLDPIVLTWGESVMAFWFGARTVFKDVPELIAAIRNSQGSK